MALSPVTRRLLPPTQAAALSESGRLARSPGPPPPRSAEQQAKIESGRLDRTVGRSRLMPFDLVLTTGCASTPLFGAGPFDELRLANGAVVWFAVTATSDVPGAVSLCLSRSMVIIMEPVVRLQYICFSSSAIS